MNADTESQYRTYKPPVYPPQKFHKGDWVRVAKDLGPSMSHFTSDCEAIVIGSYADQYGGEDTNSYTLHIEGRGQVSWYYEKQLELIEIRRIDKLEEWKAKEKVDRERYSSLNWIFENGESVLSCAQGSSVSTLADCLGVTNLWGSRGEGWTYYQNAMTVLKMAEPYLEKGDKDGWLEFCKTIEMKPNV